VTFPIATYPLGQMNVAQDIFVRPPLLCVPKLLVRAHEAVDELMSASGPKQT
jgi:hypothetical protein